MNKTRTLFYRDVNEMYTFLFVSVAAILVVILIACQLKAFKTKHPNAEMLMRFYQMIASDK